MKDKLEQIYNKLNQLKHETPIVTKEFFQIKPNPVTDISVVAYELPNELPDAFFVVYDLQGKIIKQYNKLVKGKTGTLQIKQSDFKSGMYVLSLVSNNEEIQTRRFLIN